MSLKQRKRNKERQDEESLLIPLKIGTAVWYTNWTDPSCTCWWQTNWIHEYLLGRTVCNISKSFPQEIQGRLVLIFLIVHFSEHATPKRFGTGWLDHRPCSTLCEFVASPAEKSDTKKKSGLSLIFCVHVRRKSITEKKRITENKRRKTNFSAFFCTKLAKVRPQILPAALLFIRPILSYAAEQSAS